KGKGLLSSIRNRRNAAGASRGTGLPGSGRTNGRSTLARNASGGVPSAGRKNRTGGTGTGSRGKRLPGTRRTNCSGMPGAGRRRGKGLLSGAGRRSAAGGSRAGASKAGRLFRGGGKSPSSRGKGLGRGGSSRGTGSGAGKRNWAKGLFPNKKGRTPTGKRNKRTNDSTIGKLKNWWGKTNTKTNAKTNPKPAKRKGGDALNDAPTNPKLRPVAAPPTTKEDKMPKLGNTPRGQRSNASTGGGGLVSAAEEYARAMANPSVDISKGVQLDRPFQEMAEAQRAHADGLKQMAAKFQESHPEDTATYEQLMERHRNALQEAEQFEELKGTNRRLHADDYERIEAPRKNEAGWDYTQNQE